MEHPSLEVLEAVPLPLADELHGEHDGEFLAVEDGIQERGGDDLHVFHDAPPGVHDAVVEAANDVLHGDGGVLQEVELRGDELDVHDNYAPGGELHGAELRGDELDVHDHYAPGAGRLGAEVLHATLDVAEYAAPQTNSAARLLPSVHVFQDEEYTQV